jgi:O-antigen/teichoic acid export membrane protein
MLQPTYEKQGSWLLASIALAGQVLVAVLTARLAHALSLEEFEAYAVAGAAFLLLVAIAPFGAEKLALRVLPPLLERGDWSQAHGYLRFALRRAFLGTAAVGTAGLAWALGLRNLPEPIQAAFLVAIFVLPVGVLAHLGLEMLTAAGAVRFATAVYRLAVPATALAFILLLPELGVTLTGALAIAAWGAGWMAAAAALLLRLRAGAPPAILQDPPRRNDPAWHRAAGPFWTYRIAVALMAQAGIIALEWLGAGPAAVGAYAAATAVAGLGLVLSTATNRAYSREIAILVERGAGAGLADVLRHRRRWLLPCLALYLAVVFTFSRHILGLFRADFIEEGLWPLRILALAAAVSGACALAPTVLKYLSRNRTTFRAVASAAAVQVVLLALLIPGLGATGAALAFSAATLLMYGGFARQARRELAGLQAAS